MSPATAPDFRPRLAPIRPRRCTVNLHFPGSWAVRPNPLARELARRARAWLGASVDDETYRQLSVGELGNWPFPFAEEDRAETITRAMAACALGIDRKAELNEAFGRAMSGKWMSRYASHVAERVRVERLAELPTVNDHLLRCRASLGLRAAFDLIEYQIAWELPGEVAADPELQEALYAAADCVAIGKDLCGFTNDRAQGRANFVLCAANEFGDDAGEAFKWVSHMHTCQVQELRRYETVLMTRYPRHPMLTAWFDALHCAIYGFAQWHSRAPRFQATHLADGWTVQITITPACPDPF
ncbi:MAG: hypothetical protein HYX27_25615 [Acidobacteria bacterium]|nr:hypothetical protein [Acidobacteriota bacterium]